MTVFSSEPAAEPAVEPVNGQAVTPAAPDIIEPHEAWVVFSGEADLWWLKVLKPGFRHCFVIARDTQRWIVMDPLSPHIELAVLPLPVSFDLPHWLRAQDMTVIDAPITRQYARPAPLGWFSCVEVIKRFLGIHARGIVTPWQLYRYLMRHKHRTPCLRTHHPHIPHSHKEISVHG